ncbi:MAG: hypothetical protein Tsb0015_12190 [Simkaniaceae bacterium]
MSTTTAVTTSSEKSFQTPILPNHSSNALADQNIKPRPQSPDEAKTLEGKLTSLSEQTMQKALEVTGLFHESIATASSSVSSNSKQQETAKQKPIFLKSHPETIGTLTKGETTTLYEQITPHLETFVEEAQKSPNGTVYINRCQNQKLIRPIIVNREGKIFIVCKKHQQGEAEDESYAIDKQIGKGGGKVVWYDFDAEKGSAGAFARPRYSAANSLKHIAALNTSFRREFQYLKQLSSNNELLLVEYTNNKGEPRVGMHQPKYDYDLYDFIIQKNGNQETIKEKIAILKQISQQVESAHEKGVLHNDIKPENIFIKNGKAFLQDWGLATNIYNPRHLSGSLHIMAPEKFNSTSKIDSRSDVWSLGLLFAFVIYTSEDPGNPDNVICGQPQEILADLVGGNKSSNSSNSSDDFDFSLFQTQMTQLKPGWFMNMPIDTSKSKPELDQLIAECLDPNPENRPKAKQVRERIEAIESTL